MRRSLLWLGLFAGLTCLANDSAQPSQVWLERFDADPVKGLPAMGWSGGHLDHGPQDFFLMREGSVSFARSKYIPGTEALYLHKEVDWDTTVYPWLCWKWRVQVFPARGKILDPALSDAPAQIYVLWREFPRYYVIKYFWATSEKVGETLHQSNLFTGRLYGEILRSGGAVNQWQAECRNVLADFQREFERKPPGKVRAIAFLPDGDDSHGEAEADYTDFQILTTKPAMDEKPTSK